MSQLKASHKLELPRFLVGTMPWFQGYFYTPNISLTSSHFWSYTQLSKAPKKRVHNRQHSAFTKATCHLPGEANWKTLDVG